MIHLFYDGTSVWAWEAEDCSLGRDGLTKVCGTTEKTFGGQHSKLPEDVPTSLLAFLHLHNVFLRGLNLSLIKLRKSGLRWSCLLPLTNWSLCLCFLDILWFPSCFFVSNASFQRGVLFFPHSNPLLFQLSLILGSQVQFSYSVST